MKQFIAQKRLCFAALLETILCKYGIESFNQIRIANDLGITLPPNDVLLKDIRNAKISENFYDWGMNFKDDDLRSYFFKEKIFLNFDYAFSKIFEDWSFEIFINERLIESNIICTIDYNTLFNSQNNEIFGHAILLKKINGTQISIFDPGPEFAGDKIIDVYDLYVASKRMNGGLWVFRI